MGRAWSSMSCSVVVMVLVVAATAPEEASSPQAPSMMQLAFSLSSRTEALTASACGG